METMDLIGGQRLLIEHCENEHVLKILGSDQQVTLSIQITSAGPVLNLHQAGLILRSDGDFAVDARHVTLHGREGVTLTSDGGVKVCAAGDLESRARIQNVTAELGNVNIRANDDVKLNGERIMMNC